MLDTRHSLLISSVTAALMVSPAFAENPYLQSDDTWISIDGEVEGVSADAFTLDYGDGIITVEMDDGDRDADGYKLVPGDKVTVSGKIDDDFYEVASIEASSVFVESLGTQFYASAVDEEDTIIHFTPVVVAETILRGEVTSVDQADREFTVDNGTRELTVNVDELSYNPLDDSGYQKISEGDVVSVTGEMNAQLFDRRQFDADAVITLKQENRDA
jgi:uncharacterized protein YdeI (BOF family)